MLCIYVLTGKTYHTECNLSYNQIHSVIYATVHLLTFRCSTIKILHVKKLEFFSFVSDLNPPLSSPDRTRKKGKSDGPLTIVSHQRVQTSDKGSLLLFAKGRIFQTNCAAGSEFFVTICVLWLVESYELLQPRLVGDRVSSRCPFSEWWSVGVWVAKSSRVNRFCPHPRHVSLATHTHLFTTQLLTWSFWGLAYFWNFKHWVCYQRVWFN